jgi:hypothetical protein
MKKVVIFIVFSAVMMISASWMMEGCQEKLAPLGSIVATATPVIPDNIISVFYNNTTKMNTNLLNSLNGYFENDTYADTSTTMILTAPVPSDGNSLALHIFGTYTDPGTGTYPAFELDGYPRSNNTYYDASSFTGIKFLWNCPSDDNSIQRFFDLVTARMAPTNLGGTGLCGTTPPVPTPAPVPCYDYLSKTLPKTFGVWMQETIPFSSLILQYSSGTPGTIQPSDIQQILELQWKNDSNNNAGSYTADYWIDNVQFY